MTKYKTFFKLITFCPNLQIGVVSDSVDTQLVLELSKELFLHEGILNLYEISDETISIIHNMKLQNVNVTKILNINELELPSREFEFIIVINCFEQSDFEKLLTKCYNSLELVADIAIIEKNNHVEQIKDVLDITNFKSPNEIDILENSFLVKAKKLQMWCN
ncbi:MAG: hypothetical protein HXX81_01975 [Campylobacterales bacterium]|nr:hypothetical protein [Campylobacterales bacterium]